MDALRRTGVTIRQAGPDDAVAGVTPRLVALPETTGEVAVLMRLAAEHDLAVVPVGDGTKLGWGAPPERCDLLIDTCCLTLDGGSTVEHAPGDLIVRVSAGVPAATLASLPGSSGFRQELALDNPLSGGTVGGTLATAIAGPRRFRYGTARDLLIGVTVVLADGTTATSGGRVVKNVAGYDLGKLFCGSYGTLGVITEAIFRLHPVPAGRHWVVATLPSPGAAAGGGPGPEATAGPQALVAALAASQAEPSAIELDWPAPHGDLTLAVLVEGRAAGERALPLRDLIDGHIGGHIGGHGAHVSDRPPPWWNTLPGEKVLLELRFPPAGAGDALRAVAARGLPARVRGSVASGVLHAALPPAAGGPELAAFVSAVRDDLGPLGGGLTVLAVPPEPGRAVERWGPVGALPLMRRVKERFDPGRRMSPGRFAGGI